MTMLAGLLASAAVVVTLDQGIKMLVINWLREGQSRPAGGFLRLHRVTRAGFRFISLSSRDSVFLWLSLFVCIVSVLTAGIFPDRSGVALGVALGGATGNLCDRIFRGGIVDFIALGRWPVFNVADIAMVAAPFGAAWSLL
jgi:signal peptidase II